MRFALLAATAALTFAAPASAATVVQSGTVSNLTLPGSIAQFNPLWGDLQGIHVKQTFFLTGSAFGTQPSSTWDATFLSGLSTQFGGCAPCNTTIQTSNVGGTVYATITRTVESDLVDWAALTGSGNFLINQFGFFGITYAQTGGVPSSISPSARDRYAETRYEVTYVFDSTTGTVNAPGAVPEPATWAMMLAGFGAVGASMRARRSRQPLKLSRQRD